VIVASLPGAAVARGAAAPVGTSAAALPVTKPTAPVDTASPEGRDDYLPRPMHERIRAAAGDGARNLAIDSAGHWKLKIRFQAASANEARAAVQRVSSLSELARYEVDFGVSVGK